jgi:hypothetical protein
MTTTPRYALPHIISGQAQKEITHNAAISLLDALVMLRVIDRDLTTPPATPVNGDSYVVAASATGAWATHDNKIAIWFDGWSFITPQNGMRCFVTDENRWVDYFAGAWSTPQLNAVTRLQPDGINRPVVQFGSGLNSIFMGDSSATFTNSIAYIGFNAVRSAANTWTYTGDGTRNGGAVIDGRMDGAIRIYVRATSAGTTTTETDATAASNERFQVQRAQVSLGGSLGAESLRVPNVASCVNRMEILGSATGSATIIRNGGTDTNIDLQIGPKGTGQINLALDATNLVTTVGATGAASALPANPVGYLRIKMNGTTRKIPYYND